MGKTGGHLYLVSVLVTLFLHTRYIFAFLLQGSEIHDSHLHVRPNAYYVIAGQKHAHTGIEIFFTKYLQKVQMGYLYYLHFGMSTCTLVDTCMVVHVFLKL